MLPRVSQHVSLHVSQHFVKPGFLLCLFIYLFYVIYIYYVYLFIYHMVCIYACVYVFACVWIHKCMIHTHVYVPKVDIDYLPRLLSTLFTKRGSSLNLKIVYLSSPVSQFVHGISFLCLPNTKIQENHHSCGDLNCLHN